MAFQSQRQLPSDMVHRDELHAQVRTPKRLEHRSVKFFKKKI